jgi:chromosome condensin MukBEF MukE localization factor
LIAGGNYTWLLEAELARVAEQGQQAVTELNRITELMAESRLLELEITNSMFGALLDDRQLEKMRGHIEEFRRLTKKAGIGEKTIGVQHSAGN